MLTAQLRSNFRHLYADIFWFGVLAGTTISFLAVYASRLGASGLQVGLLSAGPGAVNLLVSLPAAQWMAGRSLFRVSYLSSLVQRVFYVILIALPWLFSEHFQVWTMIFLSLLMSLPGALMMISFNAMFVEVVPPANRSEVVGKRNALLAVSMTLTMLLAGQLLDRVIFPLDYQIVFAIGAAGALLSTYHVGRIRPDPSNGQPVSGYDTNCSDERIKSVHPSNPRSSLAKMLRLDLLRGPFGAFIAAYLAFYTFQYVPLPLFPLFVVNDLHFSDGIISLASALFYFAMFLFSLRLDRFSVRFGHRRLLVVGGIIFPIYPLLVGLSKTGPLYYVASVLGGANWALLGGALLNRLMERVPADDRPAHMALHNLALSLGILAGSLLAPLLGDWLGLRDAILLSAALRFLGGALLWVWG